MNKSWEITAKRIGGSADPVTIDGNSIGKDGLAKHYGTKITRHHIINIQVLKKFWNEAVARRDSAVFQSLATWCGYSLSDLSGHLNNPVQADVTKFQKAVGWNPFNLVLGPSTENRVGDPGEAHGLKHFLGKPVDNEQHARSPYIHLGFDDLKYTNFGSIGQTANDRERVVARMEFNQHIDRSRKLNYYMALYIDTLDKEIDQNSLNTLLRSDRAANYPTLFKRLRSNVGPTNTKIGATGLPGCLTDPLLWQNISVPPTQNFAEPADADKHKKRAGANIVPWVSASGWDLTLSAHV